MGVYKTVSWHFTANFIFKEISLKYGLLYERPLLMVASPAVNKSLVLELGTSQISIRTSIFFYRMSNGKVGKYSASLYFLDAQCYFATGHVKF